MSMTTSHTVLCYDPPIHSWKIIKSPTRYSALTTYQGKLVLVGGIDDTQQSTNKLWCLQDDDRWTNELLPMPTPRWGASAINTGSHLIIAGGGQPVAGQELLLIVVEVFDGRQWTRTESLPKACYNMKSTLHNGEWYLIGGQGQGKSVFCATVESLIATAGSSEGEGGSVWKTLPEAPLERSSIVMYGNLLLAIGGTYSPYSPQSAVYGYITPSWMHIGDLPVPIYSTCSIVLPSSELLVVGGHSDSGLSSSVLKATPRVNPFQLDGQLSVAALSRLQYTVGVPLFQSIGEVWALFAQFLNMNVVSMQTLLPFSAGPEVVGREVVKLWLRGSGNIPPTWQSLLWVLTSLPQLAPLAEIIKRFFVIPLLEDRTGEHEHHLDRHEETIQQLREEEQVALQREEAVVREKEKRPATRPLPIKLEPGIKQEPESEDIKKEVVLDDPVSIKREEEGEEAEVEMAVKKFEQMKEAYTMLEEDLSKYKQESETRCHELQSQLNTVVTDRDTVEADVESALAERDRALEERDKLRIRIVEKEGISMELQKELRELQSQLNTAVTDRDTDALAERDRALEERDKLKMELEQKEAISMGFLRGVDVVAETSLEVSSQAHTYHWEGYGVKLHIPQDSLPADCQRCRVEMRASLSGHYALPAGCELVSGVYWMYCPVKFCKRVTLEVQHCSKQTEGLSFVRANCTQEQLPYTFQSVETGVFSESSSYGSVELSRFSGWAIVKSFFSRPNTPHQPADRRYWAQVCYRRVEEGIWDVRFVVTWKLKAHIKAARQDLKSETDRNSFTVAPEFETAFDDFIELDIPKKGLTQDGWSIKPLYHPRILRSQVDTFKPGELLHHCQLRVQNTGSIIPLVLDVTMKGVREGESEYFTCVISEGPSSPSSHWSTKGLSSRKRGPPSPSSSPASLSGPTTPEAADGRGGEETGTSGKPAKTAPLNKKPRLSPSVEDNSEDGSGPGTSGGTSALPVSMTPPSAVAVEHFIEKVPPENRGKRVKELVEVAQIAKEMVQWENVAPYLGLKQTEVEAVKKDFRNYEEQKKEVILKWRNSKGPSATYEALVRTFHSCGEIAMVEQLCTMLGADFS